MSDRKGRGAIEELSLEKSASLLLEECRMVLPGIQALFGFQFVVVFNSAFSAKLTRQEQMMHVGALLCVLIAAALVLAPAAIHRQTQPRAVSEQFIATSTKLLTWSMAPLAIGTTIDVYLVGRAVTQNTLAAAAAAAFALLMFVVFWALLPRKIGGVGAQSMV